jgi:GAF domain-containing protein/HAMP domain-containing protein
MGNSLASQIELIETLGLNKKIEESLESINKGYEVYNGNMTAILADMDRLDKQWRTADAANNNASPLIRAVLSNDMTTELVSFQKENPDHVEIFLTDKYGAIRASTNRTSDYYQADEDWWQTAFNDGQGGIYLGQPEYDESSQTFAVNIAVPINVNETGELVGVLRTTYKISALVKILASLRFGETGDAALVFPNGEILESTGNRLPTDADTLAQIKNIGTEYNQMTFQGKSRIITQSPISTFYVEEEKEVVDALGWTMIIFQDRSEALKTLNVVTRNAILVALSILILVSVVAYALSNNLARPILSLTETANQVRGGDFNARASVETQDEFKTLADTFNEMTERLRETLGGLEKRVEDRTAELQQAIVQSETRAKQLQSIADISRIITREQNLQRLLPLVADIVGERFSYYHVGIFLIDESRRFAVLQASNSAGGQQMLNSGHKLELATTSIVGYVALTSNPRIALDVGADAVFFNNPNLPETRSEMALPLNVRNVIIGVLDLQSTESSAFTQDDVNTLAVLADQVAIAIENARLIRETQTALEESRAVFQSYLKQEWSALATQKTTTGYIQSATGGQLLTTPVTENEIEQAIKKGIIIKKEKYSRGPDSSILAVPIKLGDQVLGAIRIQSSTKGHEWSTEEVNLVRAISERVGLAIENARLIENSQKRASKERAIGEISAKISTAAGMDSILETAVQELGRILSGSDVVIQFAQEEEIRQYDSQQE